MRIATFHTEFTSDLESFVKNPIQIPTITEWNPELTASPERHLNLGKKVNLTTEVQIYTLEKENEAFDHISSLLRIYLDRKVLRNIPKLDPVREQIWLFGYKWLEHYYQLLTEPDILKSEFYRRYHDDFLSLLGKMLETNPKHRISFSNALQEWHPSSVLLQKVDREDNEDREGREDKEDREPARNEGKEDKAENTQDKLLETQIVPYASTTSSEMCHSTISTVSVSTSASSSSVLSPSNHLVLGGLRHVLEHNKTRKNPRN